VNRRYYRCYPRSCSFEDVYAIEEFQLRKLEGMESITIGVSDSSDAIASKAPASVALVTLLAVLSLALAVAPGL
jgi:hypothetical protein